VDATLALGLLVQVEQVLDRLIAGPGRARQKAAARDAAVEAWRLFDALTPTEARVAELVASGHSNKQVAAQLYMSVRTVEAKPFPDFRKARRALTHRAGSAPLPAGWVTGAHPSHPFICPEMWDGAVPHSLP